MNIIVKSDYDRYFEQMTRDLIALVNNPKYKTIVVTAGPYRSYGMNLTQIDADTVGVDYYSALRAGFGSLSQSDIQEAARLLEA